MANNNDQNANRDASRQQQQGGSMNRDAAGQKPHQQDQSQQNRDQAGGNRRQDQGMQQGSDRMDIGNERSGIKDE